MHNQPCRAESPPPRGGCEEEEEVAATAPAGFLPAPAEKRQRIPPRVPHPPPPRAATSTQALPWGGRRGRGQVEVEVEGAPASRRACFKTGRRAGSGSRRGGSGRTCQRVLLLHIPHPGCPLSPAGQDPIRCGVEEDHARLAPLWPQGHAGGRGEIRTGIQEAPDFHLWQTEEVMDGKKTPVAEPSRADATRGPQGCHSRWGPVKGCAVSFLTSAASAGGKGAWTLSCHHWAFF